MVTEAPPAPDTDIQNEVDELALDPHAQVGQQMEEHDLKEMTHGGVEMKFITYDRKKIDKAAMETDGVLEKYTISEEVTKFSMKAVKD